MGRVQGYPKFICPWTNGRFYLMAGNANQIGTFPYTENLPGPDFLCVLVMESLQSRTIWTDSSTS